MKIGCFALIDPFTSMDHQFKRINEMGIEYADLTDNHDGATLGTEFGFAASVSLSSHPERIAKMARDNGVKLSCICAHANLLDPISPDVYSTEQIIKAIKLAHFLGVKQVITTEGDPKTEFGKSLTESQRIFSITERLYWPLKWAESLGVELLLEPHGIVTDSVEQMAKLIDSLGNSDSLGVCLDTGNSWLGGANPLDYVKAFGTRIKHVHWKDMSKEWESKRGSFYGCGMATIPLGDGLVGIPEIVKALLNVGFEGHTTLEVAGEENVKLSFERLQKWLNQA